MPTENEIKSPMLPAEFAEKMRIIFESSDYEDRHGKADDLMCTVLRSWGYSRGIDIYQKGGTHDRDK